MNIANIICILIIGIWLILAIRFVIKKKDCCSCGCGCKNCSENKGSCNLCH